MLSDKDGTECRGNIKYILVAREEDGVIVCAKVADSCCEKKLKAYKSEIRKILQAPDFIFQVVPGKMHRIVREQIDVCTFMKCPDGGVYFVVTKPEYNICLCHQLLRDFIQQFKATYGHLVKSATEDSLSKDSEKLLTRFIEEYDKTELQKVIEKRFENVRALQAKNVEDLKLHYERTEEVAYKAKNTSDTAADFEKATRKVKKQIAWKKRKRKFFAVVGVVVTALIVVVVVVI